MLGGVVGLGGDAEAGGVWRDSRGADGGDEEAGIEEGLGDAKGVSGVAEDDGDDLAGRIADVESHLPKFMS